MTGFECWLSGCYRVFASEQDLNWGRDMACFNDGFGAGRSASHGGRAGKPKGAMSARPWLGSSTRS